MKLITVHNRWGDDGLFFSESKGAGTVVLEEPDPETILSALQKQFKDLTIEQVTVKIGAAFLHPRDQLNKKEGRKIAISRMRDVQFKMMLGQYENMADALFIVLYGPDSVAGVHYSITCKIYRDDRKLRVMGASTTKLDPSEYSP